LIVESRQTIENNLLSLSVGSWQFMKTCMKTQQVFFLYLPVSTTQTR